LTIFGEKIGVFLKNQCYDQLFKQLSFVLSQKRPFFRRFFGENIFQNHNIGPCLLPMGDDKPVEPFYFLGFGKNTHT
jgi:hypothetical protein